MTSMPGFHVRRLCFTIASVGVFAGACARAPRASGDNDLVRNGLARVRAATARFVSLDTAVAAGYARDVSQCIAHPQHGAMGFHHINRAYVDTRIEVERPEFLLYERQADGRYTLTAVEYIIPFRLWPRDSVPPTVFGLDLRREEELRLWYLHMWAWTENAAGLFADWNPAIRCPTG